MILKKRNKKQVTIRYGATILHFWLDVPQAEQVRARWGARDFSAWVRGRMEIAGVGPGKTLLQAARQAGLGTASEWLRAEVAAELAGGDQLA